MTRPAGMDHPAHNPMNILSMHLTKPSKSSTIIVGLSGGVDSSVAAKLCQDAGFKVEGLFMKNWEEDDEGEYCAAAQDLKDVRAICQQLKIPLHTVNFSQEYWQSVFSDFLEEYKKGRTPNPDVLCNKEIKFKHFLNHARKLGADHIATGHYIKQISDNDIHTLHQASDLNKDQSYFLYTLTQAQLNYTCFPLADLKKPQIRAIAQESNLITHNKKDSTGLCFIGERKFRPFLSEFLSAQKGLIKTPQGQNLGEHEGVLFYTLGQRQGLHIGGQKNHLPLPWYVVGKDAQNNILYVSQDPIDPWHYATQITVKNPSWIAGHPHEAKIFTAKTRYRQKAEPCEMILEVDQLQVRFFTPQKAVTPGQSLVLYDGHQMLGGGIIESTNSPGGLNLD